MCLWQVKVQLQDFESYELSAMDDTTSATSAAAESPSASTTRPLLENTNYIRIVSRRLPQDRDGAAADAPSPKRPGKLAAPVNPPLFVIDIETKPPLESYDMGVRVKLDEVPYYLCFNAL